MSSTRIQPEQRSFEREAVDILARVRTALAAIVAAAPGNVTKAADLQRALSLDMKLSWKLFKVIEAPDVLASGPHVPGSANIRTFLRAAARCGVEPSLIAAAADASERFQRLVSEHAGERATFDSMVSGLSEHSDAEQIDLRQKRAAFRANRHLWGVQARTHLRTFFLQPAESDPNMLSTAVVHGFINLRRLRHQTPLVVTRIRVFNNDGTPHDVEREPLDPGGGVGNGLGLLREFSTQPAPELRTSVDAQGYVNMELLSGGVGNRAAVTCIEGHYMPVAGPRYRDLHNEYVRCYAQIRIPCEALVFDLIVRAGTFPPGLPETGLFAEGLTGGPAKLGPQEGDRLRLHERVTHLGRGEEVLSTPDVPRYPELARAVFDRLGWDGGEFDVYRYRIDYPIVSATARLSFKTIDAPAQCERRP